MALAARRANEQGLAAFVEHQGRVFQLLGYTVEGRARQYQDLLEGSLTG